MYNRQLTSFFLPPVAMALTVAIAPLFVRVKIEAGLNWILISMLGLAAIGFLSHFLLEKLTCRLPWLARPLLFSMGWGVLFTLLLLPLILTDKHMTARQVIPSMLAVGLPVSFASIVFSWAIEKLRGRAGTSET